MRLTRIGLALAGAILAVGCSKKDAGPFLASTPPLAYTRFLNAVPDTGLQDWHFIDAIENSPLAIQMAYRGFTPYQGTGVGTRQLRIFWDKGGSTPFPLPSEVTPILADESITLEANKYYTIILTGNASGGSPAMSLQVIEDVFPDPGSQVAVRAINLGTTSNLASVDVYSAASTSATLPSSATFSGLGYLGQSSYTLMAPGTLALKITSGGSTSVLINSSAPAGLPASPEDLLTAVGGAAQPGSAFTAFITPRSTAGTAAPQSSAFNNPAIVYIVDKHPGS